MPRPANPDVRRRLLEAGLELLHRDGFNGAGVKDLTDAAGVPKGSFYAYFDSKEQYACAVLTEYWDRIERDLGRLLVSGRRKPLDRLTAFFRALTDDHGSRDFLVGCLIGNLTLELAASSDEVRESIAHVIRRWQAMTATCLREAQEEGAINASRDVDELAELLVEAWEGAVLRGKLEQSRRAYLRFEKVTLPRLVA